MSSFTQLLPGYSSVKTTEVPEPIIKPLGHKAKTIKKREIPLTTRLSEETLNYLRLYAASQGISSSYAMAKIVADFIENPLLDQVLVKGVESEDSFLAFSIGERVGFISDVDETMKASLKQVIIGLAHAKVEQSEGISYCLSREALGIFFKIARSMGVHPDLIIKACSDLF